MSSGNRMRNDLPALVEQAITGHPGYAEFAAWCQSQLIHPYQIYFLIWQASREALVVKLPPRVALQDPASPEAARKDVHYLVGASYNLAIDNCQKQIEAIGIKVAD